MSGLKDQFAQSPQNHRIRSLVGTGAISGITGTSCVMFRFRARSTNAATILIYAGDSSDGAWELTAGEDTGWVPGLTVDNYQYNAATGSLLDLWSLE